MKVEFIGVGHGFITGENKQILQIIENKLSSIGLSVGGQIMLETENESLRDQVLVSVERCNLLIISIEECLGCETVKDTISLALGTQLTKNRTALQKIKDAVSKEWQNSFMHQAMVFKNSIVFGNPIGISPAFLLHKDFCSVLVLPGTAEEIEAIFKNKLLKEIKGSENEFSAVHEFSVFGLSDKQLNSVLKDFQKQDGISFKTHEKHGVITVTVSVTAQDIENAQYLLTKLCSLLRQRLDTHLCYEQEGSLSKTVVNLLAQNRYKMATAESCTAGLLSKMITDVPGSSNVFEMGLTAYANYIKIEALGVEKELIDQKGAVSPEVAAQMAFGIRALSNAKVGVGITGVAGPETSENKPAGLVYIAIADSEKVYVKEMMQAALQRDGVRYYAANTALDMVRRYLTEDADFMQHGTAVGEPLDIMTEEVILKAIKTDLSDLNIQKSQMPSADEVNALYSMANDGLIIEDPYAMQNNAAEEASKYVFDDEDYDEEIPVMLLSQEQQGFVLDDIYENDDSQSGVEDGIMPTENEVAPLDKPEKSSKKRNRFLAMLFPMKEDSPTEKVRKSVFLTSLIVLIVTLCYLINYFAIGWQNNKIMNQAANEWNNSSAKQRNANGIFIGFEELMKNNSDIRAWIKIDGTNVNNPVYQTIDNDFYIDHDMNKKSSRYGALFIDKDAVVTKTATSQNLVVYGHHMRDGTMFGTLKNYTNIDFYKQHPTVRFTTLYNDNEYKVFSVFITNADPKDDEGNVFNYRVQDFETQQEFLDFIAQVQVRSIIDTDVDVQADDSILTLSTCTYEFDDARLVVMARKVRDGESNTVNTENVKLKANPLYPQAWYIKYGGSKPKINLSSNTVIVPEAIPSTEPVTPSSSVASSATSSKKKSSTSSKSTKSGSSSKASSAKNTDTTASSAKTSSTTTSKSDSTSSAATSTAETGSNSSTNSES